MKIFRLWCDFVAVLSLVTALCYLEWLQGEACQMHFVRFCSGLAFTGLLVVSGYVYSTIPNQIESAGSDKNF